MAGDQFVNLMVYLCNHQIKISYINGQNLWQSLHELPIMNGSLYLGNANSMHANLIFLPNISAMCKCIIKLMSHSIDYYTHGLWSWTECIIEVITVQGVLMVPSSLGMEPPVLKDEWKSATTMPGALSVMTCGQLRMLMWPVDNLDLEALV